MKRGLVFLCFSLFSFLAHSEFCIQSFNAYGPAYAANLKKRTDLVLNMFKDQGFCEIIKFQEVWKDSHIDHLVKGLKSLHPQKSFYHANEPFEDVSSGLLTTSVFKFLSAESLVYTEYPNGLADWFRGQLGVKKALGAVRVQLDAANKNLDTWVVNTHLHHSSKVIRLAQIVELGEYLNQDTLLSIPLILSGDFNYQPHSLEWNFLSAYTGVQDSHLEVNGAYSAKDITYDAQNPLSWGGPSRTIDYVFYRNGNGETLRPLASDVYPKAFREEYLSDHYGRRVKFQIAANKNNPSISNKLNDLSILQQALRVLKAESSSDFDWAIRTLEKKIETY